MLPADDTVRSYHDSYVYDDNTGGQLINVTRQSNKFDTNNSGNAGNEFSQVFNKELNYDDQNRLIEEITTLNAALTTGTDIPTNNDIAQYVTQYFYDKNQIGGISIVQTSYHYFTLCKTSGYPQKASLHRLYITNYNVCLLLYFFKLLYYRRKTRSYD